MKRSAVFFVLAFCYLAFFNLTSVEAQSGAAGIGIKPASIEEAMDPGETAQFPIRVTNLSGQEQTYYLYTRNIIDASDTGVPVFAEDDIEITPFELSSWLTLSSGTFTLPPAGEQEVLVTVMVPDNASPGSHFAGVFVSVEPPRLRQSGAAVGYEVANIISIRVAGEVNEQATIRQFSTDNYIYGKPEVNFNLRIENSGNTLIRPRGPLVVKNMFGSTVGEIQFNENQGGVFPGRVREFNLPWVGDPPGFGRYEAVISPVYGEEGARQTMSSTVTFWILPMNIILPALGVLAFILLATYGVARLYVNRTLAQYAAINGTRRMVRRRKQRSSGAFLILMVMLSVTALFMLIMLVLFA